MDMSEEQKVVLCCANFYERKYYLNPAFEKLPQSIKEELKIMCVLFTEDVGGILALEYKENGTLCFRVESEEMDILYDEIGSELKIRQLQQEKRQLLEELELFYKVFFLKQKIE